MSDSERGEESEEELDIDEEGRVVIGGRVDLRTRCFDGALVADAAAQAQLLEDCEAAFTARATGVGEELSAGCTFWVPAGAKPTTALERIARAVFDFHARDAQFDPAKSGAEWWTQVIDSSDEIGLHWDRDCARTLAAAVSNQAAARARTRAG